MWWTGHKNVQHCIFLTFSITDRKGNWVVAGSEDHSIRIWHLNGKQVPVVMCFHSCCSLPLSWSTRHCKDG